MVVWVELYSKYVVSNNMCIQNRMIENYSRIELLNEVEF